MIPSASKRRALELIKPNHRLRDIHKGQRCFILANGPSTLEQDLAPLKNETVFSVSTGYLHPSFAAITPKYHCSPHFTYSDAFNREKATDYLREMDAGTMGAHVFLSTTEADLVAEHGLFKGRDLSYIYFSELGSFASPSSREADISKELPFVASVPIMCLMIAMHMGFSKIYLLGVEHDVIVRGTYSYAYEQKCLDIPNPAVKAPLSAPLYDTFKIYVALWEQYRAVKSIAAERGVKVYNATAGGILDEFPRVSLVEALSQ